MLSRKGGKVKEAMVWMVYIGGRFDTYSSIPEEMHAEALE